MSSNPPAIGVEVDGVAVLLSAQRGLEARVAELRAAPGFLGAALFKPVKPSGDRLAYSRWRDMEKALAAIDSGDAAILRAAPVRATSVRLTSAPDDRDGLLVLDTPGTVMLVSRMALDPAASEALMNHLETSTDTLLPTFRTVRAVAFHASPDGTLIVELLHVGGVLALALLQLDRRLRSHRRRIAQLARSEMPELYRLEKTIPPALTAQ